MGKKLALKSKKGFTLVEIIVVLVILAILAAIAIPTYLGYVSKAKDQQIKTEARTVYVAAQAYASEQSANNATDADIAATLNSTTSSATANTGVIGTLAGGGLTGTLSDVTVSSGKVTKFTYTIGTKTCTYDPTATAIYTIGTKA